MRTPFLYIVDDDDDYRFLLKQVFTQYLPQYPAQFLNGGQALLEHVATDAVRPSLILLDLNMPKLSGYDTLLRLKHPASGPTFDGPVLSSQHHWQAVPVVMMTNSSVSHELELCYEAGANSFITKPANPEQLLQTMRSICQYWLDMNRLPGT
ncbi:response regulator [Fibrisoma montanum]|uniref:Response regulator n=1 Tax=Fibrisoma montanum TaxID=2305895 RepID=A0A418M2F9_9BACT|nr:response regulator [Fibrisoma montanum]RIV19856.1 response regulator [Fibrisoma montanum]